jgi:predicted nucleotidyltransferase
MINDNMAMSEKIHGISIPQKKIKRYCQRNHIKKLALFGSFLRNDFGSDSDIDVLVEFEKGHTPGFFLILPEWKNSYQHYFVEERLI